GIKHLNAFASTGALYAGPAIKTPVTRVLQFGQQRSIVDTQVFGAGLAARRPVGWIKLESTVSGITGFFLFFNETLSFLDGADASSITTTSFILPEIEDRGFTRVHVANPNASAANTVFELIKS